MHIYQGEGMGAHPHRVCMAPVRPTSMLSPLTLASEVARPAADSSVVPMLPTKDNEIVDKDLQCPACT